MLDDIYSQFMLEVYSKLSWSPIVLSVRTTRQVRSLSKPVPKDGGVRIDKLWHPRNVVPGGCMGDVLKGDVRTHVARRHPFTVHA